MLHYLDIGMISRIIAYHRGAKYRGHWFIARLFVSGHYLLGEVKQLANQVSVRGIAHHHLIKEFEYFLFGKPCLQLFN